ncbi:2-oxoglutarate and iron-dependent oxygenase domain-containing protein [Gordonia sp. (in: high G+C Gram-positive bacteria)]|uniref:isopenicillin N synthase family dioxygenase n=1 Tax=Gordonia sp. (in: high G+C Gram-positive bacteria) TaxID=84139 RepID=UPI002629A5B9|nr:2-oxoglutarate and iron-dependent oxygenase domain-containing protein [Gordonia sp. (in: high G+C Gram-positive bacteria)]
MTGALTELPIVDMSLLSGDESDRAAFRDALRTATHEVGFFYLVGHGIGRDVRDRLFDTARAFFALPDADKFAVEMLASPQFRGYTRFGGEYTQGAIDWREQIDLAAEYPSLGTEPSYLRLDGPNLWPSGVPDFRAILTDWQERCGALGLRLMREWALSLGAPADVFDPAFAQRPSTLIKLVRYPGRDAEADRQGVGAHKDPGVLTLLLVEPGKGGLQVRRDGGWIDAPPIDDAFVVNIGELMEYATDGYLKATMHRVQSPPPGTERLSVPFFFNPALSSAMPRITLPPELAAQARGVTDDPANPISGTFGENILKARLRAHPDVAARHHADLLR